MDWGAKTPTGTENSFRSEAAHEFDVEECRLEAAERSDGYIIATFKNELLRECDAKAAGYEVERYMNTTWSVGNSPGGDQWRLTCSGPPTAAGGYVCDERSQHIVCGACTFEEEEDLRKVQSVNSAVYS
jgi:hypothetical protein